VLETQLDLSWAMMVLKVKITFSCLHRNCFRCWCLNHVLTLSAGERVGCDEAGLVVGYDGVESKNHVQLIALQLF
jgi:hypothetical protein